MRTTTETLGTPGAPPAAPPAVHVPSPDQIDSWFGGLHVGAGIDAPSVEELQASLSWRITEPIRAVRLRERLAQVKSGKLPRVAKRGGPTALGRARAALEQRLRQVAPHLLPETGPAEIAGLTLEQLVGTLCSVVHARASEGELWLLMIAVGGCFPDQAQFFALRRDLRGVSARDATARILHHCGVWTARHHSHLRTISVVTDQPVVFTHFTALYGFNSGIQRVTRQTLSHWRAKGAFRLCALTADGTALRTLDAVETARVLEWNGDDDSRRADESLEEDEREAELIVPWKTTFFMPEVLAGMGTETVTALARFTDNRTIAIGYDTIPVSSAHYVSRGLTLQFVSYLSMVKYFAEVVAISESTGMEFEGFSRALAAQNLPGQKVVTVSLPIEHVPAEPQLAEDAALLQLEQDPLPMVLSVGSNEPRKNQLAVIYASEVLWKRGKRFSLVVLGGRGDKYFTDIPDAVAALAANGRPIQIRRDVDEADLAKAYTDARFSVFISFQEGYGLPVAESLAVGTPVVTTRYGSTAEIAAGGGCLTVDPRDDDQVVEAMARLLDDDALLEQLEHDIAEREDTTWADYAESLWQIVQAKEERR